MNIMKNNIERVLTYLKEKHPFHKDEVLYTAIINRSKGVGNKGNKTIFRYWVIKSIEQLENNYPLMKALCEALRLDGSDYRLYISLDPVDIKVAHQNLMTKYIYNPMLLDNIQTRAFHSLMSTPGRRKLRMLDCDSVEAYEKVLPIVKPWVEVVLKSVKGYHIITTRFDQRLIEGIPDLELKKVALTLI